LAALDSAGLTNHNVSLSANGRWVAAATFTSDVKVHEILYDKAGAFQKTVKVMDLKVRDATVMRSDLIKRPELDIQEHCDEDSPLKARINLSLVPP
jgi:hypothetical protein